MADNKINVGGRLHSIATGNVLGGANEIFDDDKNKKQSEINTETYSLVNNVNERLKGLSPEQQSALNVATKATNNEIKLGYYVCGTEGDVAAKVIPDATGYVLSKGGSMKVKMTNANTAVNATLNINSTGAKPLYYAGERATSNNSWEAGETVEVYYNGTNYYANNVAGGSSDGIFDISAKTGNTYETLSAALTAANSILSAGKKKGGMSIKFIQTITPAKYTVVKTEGATEQPTGTELQSDPGIISGTYTSGELSVFSTLPTTLNSSLTYYLAVTETVDEQEVTTYATWVIKYVQSSDNKYVQCRYMGTEITGSPNPFLDTANWQGVDDEPTAGSDNLVKSGGVCAFGKTGFPLVGMSSNFIDAGVTTSGQYYFNTVTKKVVYVKEILDDEHADTVNIDPIDGGVYTIGGELYIYNASTNTLVVATKFSTGERLKNVRIEKYPEWYNTNISNSGGVAEMVDAKTDIITYDKAMYCLVKNASSSSTEEDANGTRLRIIFYLNTPISIKMSSSYPFMINGYSQISDAISAGSSPQDVISGTIYRTGSFVGKSHQAGYISVSLAKSDSSVISAEDKAIILDSIQLSLYIDTSIRNTLNFVVSKLGEPKSITLSESVLHFSTQLSRNISKYDIVSNDNITIVGKNLLDKTTARLGYILNNSGVEVSDSGSYYYTQMIPCHNVTVRSNRNMQRIYKYDMDGQFLGRLDATNDRTEYTPAGDVYFIQIQAQSNAVIQDFCVIIDDGDTTTSYVDYKEYSSIKDAIYVKKPFSVFSDGVKQVEINLQVYCKGFIPAVNEYPYWEPTNVTDAYKCTPLGQYTQSIPALTNTLKYSGFLKKYFDLYLGKRADGYIVTKEELGLDSGAEVEKAANPIFSYVFTPKFYNKTVLFSAGMNTCEASTFFGLAYFIKSLMEHTEDGMAALYNSTRFVVMPVMCPTGISHNPLLYRSANDVRINKNFSYKDSWKYNYDKGGQYPGNYPDSEVETKILKAWMNKYNSATFYMDCHSDTSPTPSQANVLTTCFCSDVNTMNKLSYRKNEIIQFYRDKGYIDVSITPTLTFTVVGATDYPKTPYSKEVCNTPALMHEQYLSSLMYGSDGHTNNDDYSIKHYCALIRWYVLNMCKSTWEFVFE